MHFSVSTEGMRLEFLSSGFLRIIFIAPAGQWREQFPQSTSSVLTMQFSLIHTACPVCMEDFSSLSIPVMAPAGHTSEHFVHSGRQYPFLKLISGCMSLMRLSEGTSTLFGHTDTHSWHAVQCDCIFLRLNAPAGRTGTVLFGFCFSTSTARPPSTFFVSALTIEVAANTAVPVSMALLALSAFSCFSGSFFFGSFPRFFPKAENDMADCLHLSMQSMHTTHLE